MSIFFLSRNGNTSLDNKSGAFCKAPLLLLPLSRKWKWRRFIWQFGLLSTEIRLSFVAACFVPTLQQTIYRTGVYRKALCQFFYANAFVVCFQNQFSSFIVQHSSHLLCLCYTSFCSKVKVLCCIIENCYNVMVLSISLISFSVFWLLPIYNR